MIVLIGPCMFVAPLLVLLLPVAAVLWPIVLAVLGAVYLLLWPVARVAGWLGGRRLPAWHFTLGRWFVTMLHPWRYFDPPSGGASGAP
jgi:hypothetical protein